MIERFTKSMFGWQVEPQKTVIAEPPSPRPVSPDDCFLRLVNAASYEQIGDDGEFILRGGGYPGAVVEIRDEQGVIVDYRRKSYSSAVEARADFLVGQIADPERSAEARRLLPLVTRWRLRRDLRALKATT